MLNEINTAVDYDAIDNIISELESAFKGLYWDNFLPPKIIHQKDKSKYSFLGTMIDHEWSFYGLEENIGVLIYNNKDKNAHLTITTPKIEQGNHEYPLEEFVFEYNINKAFENIVKKYSLD